MPEESEAHPSMEEKIAEALEARNTHAVETFDKQAEFDVDIEDRLAAARQELSQRPERPLVVPVVLQRTIGLDGLAEDYRRAKAAMEAARDALLAEVLEQVN